MDFEYYNITIDENEQYWKHTTVASFVDGEIVYVTLDPEQINWSEVNQMVDEMLDT